MVNTLLALGLAAIVAATPSHPVERRQAPKFAPTKQAKAFYLVANVTKPSTDFTPSINDYVLNSYHLGAGQAAAVLTAPANGPGRLFYVNGTAEEIRYGGSTILTDGGSPSFPNGLVVQNMTQFSNGQHVSYINAGTGTSAGLSQFPSPVPALYGGGVDAQGWAICNNTLLYGPALQLEPTFRTAENNYEVVVPAGCAAVSMLPQCAELPDVPEGGIASHEYAATVQCYEDVSAIDWTVYSA